MDKLPKIGLPIIVLIIVLVIVLAKSAVTIGSGEAGVLYKTFGGGVVTDQPPLDEGFHIVAPWNKVFVYEVFAFADTIGIQWPFIRRLISRSAGNNHPSGTR